MLNCIFCHPTFAMSGALAWQVKKQILNKNIYFVVGRGVRTGYFFYPGFSSPCVRVLLSAFTHSIYYYASQL